MLPLEGCKACFSSLYNSTHTFEARNCHSRPLRSSLLAGGVQCACAPFGIGSSISSRRVPPAGTDVGFRVSFQAGASRLRGERALESSVKRLKPRHGRSPALEQTQDGGLQSFLSNRAMGRIHPSEQMEEAPLVFIEQSWRALAFRFTPRHGENSSLGTNGGGPVEEALRRGGVMEELRPPQNTARGAGL